MDHFPIFLNLQNRRALVVGGNPLATRKAALLAKSGVSLTVLSEQFSPPMRALARDNANIHLLSGTFADKHVDGVSLVLAATDDAQLDERVYAAAQARGIPVNVADKPALCSYILPAIIDRNPVVVAVSTGGRSPVLARFVKALLERSLPLTLGPFADFLKTWRSPIAEKIQDDKQRRRFWERTINGPTGQAALAGDIAKAQDMLSRDLARDEATETAEPVVLIGAPQDDPELLSIKAHRLIQQAEWVIHDDQTPTALLELSRREAHTLNADRESDDKVLSVAVKYASQGLRVVRIFGRDAALEHEAIALEDQLEHAAVNVQRIPAVHSLYLPPSAHSEKNTRLSTVPKQPIHQNSAQRH